MSASDSCSAVDFLFIDDIYKENMPPLPGICGVMVVDAFALFRGTACILLDVVAVAMTPAGGQHGHGGARRIRLSVEGMSASSYPRGRLTRYLAPATAHYQAQFEEGEC